MCTVVAVIEAFLIIKGAFCQLAALAGTRVIAVKLHRCALDSGHILLPVLGQGCVRYISHCQQCAVIYAFPFLGRFQRQGFHAAVRKGNAVNFCVLVLASDGGHSIQR